MLAREEIAALLAQASRDSNQTTITVIEHVTPVTVLNKEDNTTTTSVVQNIDCSHSNGEEKQNEKPLAEDEAALPPVEVIIPCEAANVSNNVDDDKLSDVIVVPVEPGDHQQEVYRMDQGQGDVMQQEVTGNPDQLQEANDVVTEQLEPKAQQDISEQQEMDNVPEQQELNHVTKQQDHMTSVSLLPSGSSSSVTSSKICKHKSKSSKATMSTQVSMLEEMNRQLQGADTSSSSVAVNTGADGPWNRGELLQQEGSGWSHEPSKSSGLHQTLGLQEYDEDEEDNEV